MKRRRRWYGLWTIQHVPFIIREFYFTQLYYRKNDLGLSKRETDKDGMAKITLLYVCQTLWYRSGGSEVVEKKSHVVRSLDVELTNRLTEIKTNLSIRTL